MHTLVTNRHFLHIFCSAQYQEYYHPVFVKGGVLYCFSAKIGSFPPCFSALLLRPTRWPAVRLTIHARQGFELLWSGDSVLELMRGRSIGYAVPGTGTEDYVSVYNRFFPPATYNSYISAISGAQAGVAMAC